MKSWTRRSLLTHATAGLGVAALSQLLAREGVMAAPSENLDGGIHHRAKAKRVIQLFMNGGVSQMDLFDYKPELSRRDGQTFDPGNGERVEAATSEPGKVLASPFAFSQHGETGRWVSDRLPHLAKKVDDLAFFMAMTSRTNVHGPAGYLMNTGFLLPGFPVWDRGQATLWEVSRTPCQHSSLCPIPRDFPTTNEGISPPAFFRCHTKERPSKAVRVNRSRICMRQHPLHSSMPIRNVTGSACSNH